MNKKIRISGLVQGVGFRPFVYQLATRHALGGYVRNDTEGITIEIEGPDQKVESFMLALVKELPSLARIDALQSLEGSVKGYGAFEIVRSEEGACKHALLLPDISLCEACLKEMRDPSNRRYNYPFITCTHCGPRYSIIRTLPYDRPNTSMHLFKMCAACEAEYNNPLDRRFHAQPISCFECGPTLSLMSAQGKILSHGTQAVTAAAEALLKGKIIALKGIGGFHLICDATDGNAVALLRERKKRPAKPFAVMFADMNSLSTSADLSAEEEELLQSKERPIVVTAKREDSAICEEVAPGISRIGLFLPYTPLHHLLLEKVGRPIVATSANLSGEPIITDAQKIMEKLGHVIDLVLDHDREIINSSDDSVMQVVSGKHTILRMGRGLAPGSMTLPFKSSRKILAVGAHQKDAITLVLDEKMIMSPHIGDLNSIEAFDYFERTIETFKRVYDFTPDVIVCDRHPEYETTKWAHRLRQADASIAIVEVQHHYAHLLAVKAEHKLEGKVLGFAFDGTGYGDGTGQEMIWGSEVMLAEEHGYERLCSLRPIRLLGGDLASKEPRRCALALLFEYFSLDEVIQLDTPLAAAFSRSEIELLHRAWEKGLNAPYSSSMGRLFDAVASLCDLLQTSSYEGESGLKMEACADASITQSFGFTIKEGRIDLEPMVRKIVGIHDRVTIVSMFFNTLVDIIAEVSLKYPNLPLLFSGGVFQNRVLVGKILKRFEGTGRIVCFQNETAINDGGISLGQAWFALHNP